MTTDNLFPVTDADREAAAELEKRENGGKETVLVSEMRAGSVDDYHRVQAFARHRIMGMEEAAKMRDLLKRVAAGTLDVSGAAIIIGYPDTGLLLEDVRSAIRNQDKSHG